MVLPSVLIQKVNISSDLIYAVLLIYSEPLSGGK